MAMMSILVRAAWDTEAELYVATSDDVPGLVTEAATPPELQKKLNLLVPELVELNGGHGEDEIGEARKIPMYVAHEPIPKIRIGA